MHRYGGCPVHYIVGLTRNRVTPCYNSNEMASQYDTETKAQALTLLRLGKPASHVAVELEIPERTVSHWAQRWREIAAEEGDRILTDEDYRLALRTSQLLHDALDQMEERKISEPDVECALTNGQVILEEGKTDVLWRVKGNDIDGNNIEIVVAVYEDAIEIKVVTTF